MYNLKKVVMKKKLLFVAAMMLAAFGASAQATADLAPASVIPTPGTPEDPVVVDEPFGWSTIRWTFDNPVFLPQKKERDTVHYTFNPYTYLPPDDPEYAEYGLILSVSTTGRMVTGYIAKKNEKGTYDAVTITKPDTYIVGFQTSPVGDEEWAMDQKKGHCMDISTTYWYKILKKLEDPTFSPEEGKMEGTEENTLVGGYLRKFDKITLGFGEPLFLTNGKNDTIIAGEPEASGAILWDEYMEAQMAYLQAMQNEDTEALKQAAAAMASACPSIRIELAADGMSATVTPVDADGRAIVFTHKDIYGVIIPAGTLENAEGVSNVVWSAYYQIPSCNPVSVSPEEGPVNELSRIVLTFGEKIAFNDEMKATNDTLVVPSAITTMSCVSYDARFVITDEDTALVIEVLDDEGQLYTITDRGNYKVSIPDSLFCSVNNPDDYNVAMDFSYQIVLDVTPSITPAEGNVTELSKFTLALLSNGDSMIVYPSQDETRLAGIKLLHNGTPVGGDIECTYFLPEGVDEEDEDAESMGVTISLSEKVTEPGDYTLVIPDSTLEVGEYYEPVGRQLEFVYHVLPMDSAFIPKEAIADTLQPYDLTKVYLVFEEGTAPKIVDDKAVGGARFQSRFGDEISANILTGEGDTLIIEPRGGIHEAGTYQLVVPAGVIGNEEYITSEGKSGKCNYDFEFTFVVEAAPVTTNVTIDPADGSTVKELKVFTLDFGMGVTSMADWDSIANAVIPVPDVTIKNEADEVVATATYKNDDWVPYMDPENEDPWAEPDDSKWVITFPEAVKAAGKYTLDIPEKVFQTVDTQEWLPAMTFTYRVDPSASAITEVEAAAEGVTVYNLQGVLVLQSDDAADLKTLESGLYIVNGKAMIIVK